MITSIFRSTALNAAIMKNVIITPTCSPAVFGSEGGLSVSHYSESMSISNFDTGCIK